ncbi:MAG: substrate-binding domain-containing protein [Phycisphaerae bacterium]|nr:substrate-binding domain-containing protein [Phycisphaerae bacterium]
MMETTNDIRTDNQGSKEIRRYAEAIRRHIGSSGLQPGDRYLSASEASCMLGCNITAAQRAMTHLAKIKWLERRPRAGTFVGTAALQEKISHCVHFFLPESICREKNTQNMIWQRMLGVKSVIPNVTVEFDFVPRQDLAFVQQVVERMNDSRGSVGFLVLLSSQAIREYLNQCGIPAVIFGDIEPHLQNLCWASLDQKQVGRLLAEYLVKRGHRRFITVMRDTWGKGDYLLHDSIGETLADAGLAANSLQIRSIPVDRTAIIATLRSRLEELGDEKLALICRTEFQADCVNELAESMGVTSQLDVVVCNSSSDIASCKYACVVPDLPYQEEGMLAGRMLLEMMNGRRPSPRGYSIPVRLVVPGGENESK